METKKLYKSETNKMIAGVCAGIGEYLNVDPTAVRVIWALISCCAGVGIAAYKYKVIFCGEWRDSLEYVINLTARRDRVKCLRVEKHCESVIEA